MTSKTTGSNGRRRKQVLQEVQQMIHTVLGRYPINVYLFGSWARGAPSRHSDIDVGIDPITPLPPGALANLRECFEESSIPYRVEVVDLSAANMRFREAVIHQGISWNA